MWQSWCHQQMMFHHQCKVWISLLSVIFGQIEHQMWRSFCQLKTKVYAFASVIQSLYCVQHHGVVSATSAWLSVIETRKKRAAKMTSKWMHRSRFSAYFPSAIFRAPTISLVLPLGEPGASYSTMFGVQFSRPLSFWPLKVICIYFPLTISPLNQA